MQSETTIGNPDDARGRQASHPLEIPRLGWLDILIRVKNELGEDRVGFSAAAVAFYFLMGSIPLLAACVGIYGMVADVSDVEEQVVALGEVLPSSAMELVERELKRLTEDQLAGSAGLIALLVALWGGSRAMNAIVISLNVAYDEKEKRGFLRTKLVSLGLTLGAALFLVAVVALMVAIPIALKYVGVGEGVESAVSLLRWPILFVLATVALAVLYRFGPSRTQARWQWISVGSVVATILWLLASLAFSLYAENFASYGATYGSLGGIVILLFWFFLTGFCVMLGAEINAEIEHQTKRDSTVGESKPLGDRGAYVADHVGKAEAATKEQ